MLEQGNTFPDNFDTVERLRFLMTGALLAGIVISNAFKSENVYNIVMPRNQISYYNAEELIEDNIRVYNWLQDFLRHFYEGQVDSLKSITKSFVNIEKSARKT